MTAKVKIVEQYFGHYIDNDIENIVFNFTNITAFMLERPHLACEETANYLVIQCLNLEMEEKHGAMEQVAHQCICIQYLLELAKQLDVDPRSCISSFFTK